MTTTIKVGDKYWQVFGSINGREQDADGMLYGDYPTQEEAAAAGRNWLASLSPNERWTASTYTRQFVAEVVSEDGEVERSSTCD